jgi:hypothetical protein
VREAHVAVAHARYDRGFRIKKARLARRAFRPRWSGSGWLKPGRIRTD